MGLDFSKLGPYDRVTFRGRQMNARDAAMHLEAERRFGATVYITQGGFNPGEVGASAGTHDEGGVLDTSTAGMSVKRKRKWLRACKDTGWCIWLRSYVPDLWPEHFHGVARGCRNLAPVAADQVPAFDARRNGLVSNYADLSYRPDPKVEFDYHEWKVAWVARRRAKRISDRIGQTLREIKGLRRKVLALREERQKILSRIH